jgi:hypothetical protein
MTTVPTLTIGIEIECLLPEGRTRADAAAAVQARIGKPCYAEGYNHRTVGHWKIVTDGSLSNQTRGMEVVSPKLSGEAGLAEVATVLNALQDFGVTVDKSCGFHVHVDATNDDLQFHRTLAKLYAAYESVIDQIMPKSRRGNHNNFCRSIAHASREQIDHVRSVSELATLLGRAAPAARYVKLNMTRRHPTVEFRQHSGTLEPEKALTWIKTCLRMVEKAKAGVEFNPVAPAVSRPKVRAGSKRAIVVDLLLRPQGATREEILAATGWPTVSVQDVVSRTGWELMSTRMGRRITYRLNRAAAEAHSLSAAATGQLDISIAGLCALIGSSNDERQYLERRAANLSGAHQWAA